MALEITIGSITHCSAASYAVLCLQKLYVCCCNCVHITVCTAVHESALLKQDSYFSCGEVIITPFLKQKKRLLNMHSS